ncbi:hypothetical protein BDR03DRAFT_967738 [Suillus americanus]|nr:hypothetical protein BDR03DRAFT_967738 [Suillus americanus]
MCIGHMRQVWIRKCILLLTSLRTLLLGPCLSLSLDGPNNAPVCTNLSGACILPDMPLQSPDQHPNRALDFSPLILSCSSTTLAIQFSGS